MITYLTSNDFVDCVKLLDDETLRLQYTHGVKLLKAMFWQLPRLKLYGHFVGVYSPALRLWRDEKGKFYPLKLFDFVDTTWSEYTKRKQISAKYESDFHKLWIALMEWEKEWSGKNYIDFVNPVVYWEQEVYDSMKVALLFKDFEYYKDKFEFTDEFRKYFDWCDLNSIRKIHFKNLIIKTERSVKNGTEEKKN